MAIAAFCVALGACPNSGRQPEKSQKRVDLARDLIANHQDAAAETEARKAIALDGRNEEAWNVLGLVYLYRANRNSRLIEIDDCLDGQLADQLRNDVDAQMRQAAEAWRRATQLAPDFGEAWHNQAVVALHFQDWDDAIAAGERALGHLARLEPTTEALAHANLGWAFYGKRNFARAASELLKATQLQPDFCVGNFRLASVLFDREEFSGAVERLAPYLETPKECPVQEAFYLLGQGYLRLHDPDSAAAALRMCQQLAPRSCQARQCEQALREITPRAERVE